MKKLKIALLSPPWIALPPKGYGGTERVVYQLAEGLKKRGHQVMVFATGDSKVSCRLEFFHKKALGNDWYIKTNIFLHLLHIFKFISIIKKENFDIIHNHAGYAPLFFLSLQSTPFVTTLHGPFYKALKKLKAKDDRDIEIKLQILNLFKNYPFISISNNQRTGFPTLNYIKTVYNGIDPNEFQLGKGKGGYLAWLGRITLKKGLDTAIKVAEKVGLPLKIGAFIDPLEMTYFNEQIKPLIDKNKSIEFLGEIKNPKEKSEFLGGAIATLYPIRWNEPFGIVMIESMACGTPVIAFKKGSVPEVIEDGKTGFIVEDEDEMIRAIGKLSKIDRAYCREYVIANFTVDKMVDDYLQAYQMIINNFSKIKKLV